jgi:uncharacterized membrane protein
MKLRRNEILTFIIVVAMFIAAALIYPHLPEKVASHWSINNQVNGYMGRFWGAFLLPIIGAMCWLLFMFVPRIDPKRRNIEKFKIYFDLFIFTFLFFLAYIYSLTIFWNLGYRFVFIQFLAPAFALLFYVVGIMIGHAEPNWTIGIRTPWTLSNEEVWYKTHKLGGKLFRVVAVLSLLGLIFPQHAVWFILVPVVIVAIYLVVYSYLEYRKKISTPNL